METPKIETSKRDYYGEWLEENLDMQRTLTQDMIAVAAIILLVCVLSLATSAEAFPLLGQPKGTITTYVPQGPKFGISCKKHLFRKSDCGGDAAFPNLQAQPSPISRLFKSKNQLSQINPAL